MEKPVQGDPVSSGGAGPRGEDSGPPSLDGIYGEILAAIRTTDETSFKLLGLVPLVSGVASSSLSFLFPEGGLPDIIPVVLLAVLGAAVTHCLFRWEQRNIQTCDRLWLKLEFVERQLGFGELSGRPEAPRIRGRRWGKTESETWIYWAAKISWLVPVITVAVKLLTK